MPTYYNVLISPKIPSTVLSIILNLLSGHCSSNSFPYTFRKRKFVIIFEKYFLFITFSYEGVLFCSLTTLPGKCQHRHRNVCIISPSSWKYFSLIISFSLVCLFCFWRSHWSQWPGIHYGAQAVLNLTILISQPLKWWDYRHMPLHLAHWLLSKKHNVDLPLHSIIMGILLWKDQI